jgi:exopolysaccharide transport family protein
MAVSQRQTSVFWKSDAAEDVIVRMPTGPAAEAQVNVRELLRRIWRRKVVLAGSVVTMLVLTIIATSQMTARYTAVSKVMLDPRRTQTVNIEAVVSGLPQDIETLESEMEVLNSRALAERVVIKLDLYRSPEFNAALRPKGLLAMLSPRTWLPDDVLGLLAPRSRAQELSASDAEASERSQVVENLLEHVKVTLVGRSRVMEISAVSEDPKLASDIANAFADLYIVEQLEAKFEATKRATEWLNERLSTLRTRVEASERAVEDFRKAHGLIEGKGVTAASQQISELNSQIILARTKRAEAEARLRQVEQLLRSSAGAESVAEVLASPLIGKLREQEAEVQRKAAEMSQEFGERHPKIINIQAEIRDLQTKIRAEVNKVVLGLRNEVTVADVRERSLERDMSQLEARAAVLNSNEVQLRSLQREAGANRSLYETFLSRFKETSAQQDLQQPDARILSSADTPFEPSFPKTRLFLAVAFVGGVLIGLALIALIEHLDNGFRSMEEVEQLMGVSALGLVPVLTGPATSRKPPQDFILEKPISAFGESIRAIHAGLLLSNVDAPPRTVLITSALPEEGKTSVSLSLTRLVSRMGQKRTVIIDCDLRRPSVHGRIGLGQTPGLVEYLAGEATLEEVLQLDEPSGARVIAAGRSSVNPMDLLASEQFKGLLRKLTETFDIVILDSSPVMAVSDSRILARLVDKTIFVVRWSETRREVAMMGLKQIVEAGASVAGVVLSMVNVKKHAAYGYGDSGSYYGRYSKYYTS